MKVKTEKDAIIVRNKFEQIAEKFGIKIVVDINHTLEPAGVGVGPALEAIDVLKVLEQDSTRPMELEKRSIRLAGMLLNLCYTTTRDKKDGIKEAQRLLENGNALKTFQKLIKAQYGNPYVTSKTIEKAQHTKKVFPSQSGTIVSINNYHLNAVAKILGAPEDHKAGIELYVKSRDFVSKNRPLMMLYSSNEHRLSEAIHTVESFPIYLFEE